MPKSVMVRYVKDTDFDAVCNLFWLSWKAHEAHDALDALKSQEDCLSYIRSEIAENMLDKECVILVAVVNGDVSGVVMGHVGTRDDFQLFMTEKVGFIDELSVFPENQHQGLGGILIDEMVEELKERGVSHIGIGVSVYNTIAMMLYQNHGFIPNGLWMIKKIDEVT